MWETCKYCDRLHSDSDAEFESSTAIRVPVKPRHPFEPPPSKHTLLFNTARSIHERKFYGSTYEYGSGLTLGDTGRASKEAVKHGKQQSNYAAARDKYFRMVTERRSLCLYFPYASSLYLFIFRRIQKTFPAVRAVF